VGVPGSGVPGSAWQTSSPPTPVPVAEGAAIAYVRRFSLAEHGDEQPGRTDAFDELALFVLVYRDGAWWLAAGLHTPDRRDVYR
jgi:hypothetical protein